MTTQDKEYMTIGEIIRTAEESFMELALIGYDQMSCNDEQLTDFGDAIRIYIESNHSKLNFTSARLLAFFIHLETEKRWINEFGELA